MTIAATSMTAEALWDLPPDNLRHELIRGELTTMPPTGAEHGMSSFNIAGELRAFIKAHDLGVGLGAETGFIIRRQPDTVLAPDCAFVRKDRIPPTGVPRKFWPIAPDLAVEVLSPSDRSNEVLEKVDEWLSAGTRLVWLIDPVKKFVTIYAPDRQPQIIRGDAHLSGEDVLPGFDLPVADIFK